MKYKVARDAGNGRFVSLLYAALHPLTTVVETVTRKK
jgi:hypothetical protein